MIVVWNSMMFHDFRDSRMQLYDVHDFHDPLMEINEFNDFHNSKIEF